MTRQEEIREGIAKSAYVWEKMRGEELSFEAFDKLSQDEKKPYYVLAYQLAIALDKEGVVIRGLPLGASYPHLSAYFTVVPLIEEK